MGIVRVVDADLKCGFLHGSHPFAVLLLQGVLIGFEHILQPGITIIQQGTLFGTLQDLISIGWYHLLLQHPTHLHHIHAVVLDLDTGAFGFREVLDGFLDGVVVFLGGLDL